MWYPLELIRFSEKLVQKIQDGGHLKILYIYLFFFPTGYCLHIKDIERGGHVVMRGKDLGGVGSLFGDFQYNCIWQLRIPTHLRKRGMRVYVHFHEANFKGEKCTKG